MDEQTKKDGNKGSFGNRKKENETLEV